MIEGLTSSQTTLRPGRNETTRSLDTAVGVLVGWRRHSTLEAFRELLAASERHGVPLFALAGALVNLATGEVDQGAGSAAQQAAELEWGVNRLL